MHYTTLGNTGLVVSRMAFGAMTFTAGNRDLATISKVGAELADQLVGRSLDAGITLFDTADGYAGGESERLLGRALRSRRHEVVITTKVGFRTGPALLQSGLSRRHILWSVDQSLLSGKYTRQNLADPDNRFSGFDILPFDKERGFALVERMRGLAARHQATVAQVALAWLLAKPAVSSIVLGASKLSQLEDNLGADRVSLAPGEIAELDAATTPGEVYPNWFTDRIAVDQPLAKALQAGS